MHIGQQMDIFRPKMEFSHKKKGRRKLRPTLLLTRILRIDLYQNREREYNLCSPIILSAKILHFLGLLLSFRVTVLAVF